MAIPHSLKRAIFHSAHSDAALHKVETDFVLQDKWYSSLVRTMQTVDMIYGGVKVNALLESAYAIINHRINTLRYVFSAPMFFFLFLDPTDLSIIRDFMQFSGQNHRTRCPDFHCSCSVTQPHSQSIRRRHHFRVFLCFLSLLFQTLDLIIKRSHRTLPCIRPRACIVHISIRTRLCHAKRWPTLACPPDMRL